MDPVIVVAIAWIVLYAAFFGLRSQWHRRIIGGMLFVAYATMIVYAAVIADAVIGMAATGLAFMTWLLAKDRESEEDE